MSFVLSFLGLSAKLSYKRKWFHKAQGCCISSRCCLSMWLVCSSDRGTSTTTEPSSVCLKSVIWPEQTRGRGSWKGTIHRKKGCENVNVLCTFSSFPQKTRLTLFKRYNRETFERQAQRLHRCSCKTTGLYLNVASEALQPTRGALVTIKRSLNTSQHTLKVVHAIQTKEGKKRLAHLVFVTAKYKRCLKWGLQRFDHTCLSRSVRKSERNHLEL